MGVLCETFETAVTWDKLPALIDAVKELAPTATCRLTHVYPDGAAPYFTVLAPADRGDEIAQWAAIKAAVSDAVLAAGGTITHHHAVGREHAPWWARQRPDPFAAALRAAKSALDPDGLLNPGVLWGP
jgi:alkyldihydroxyacetonephosphate synthase